MFFLSRCREQDIIQWGIDRNLIGPTGEGTRIGQQKKTEEEVIEYSSKKEDAENNKEGFKRLIGRFQPDNISESTPNNKYTSYSVNKGQKIVFCLRAKGKPVETLVEDNIIMFVALHELAHIMTVSVGHTEEFWENFRVLLRVAIKLKLYQDQDYASKPVDYCGTKITDTPLKK